MFISCVCCFVRVEASVTVLPPFPRGLCDSLTTRSEEPYRARARACVCDLGTAAAPSGQGLLIIEASRSQSDTPHSVGLTWKSDQPDAGIHTWQHTEFTKDRHPFPRRDPNPQSQQAKGRRLAL
jgi:hypothetical protein